MFRRVRAALGWMLGALAGGCGGPTRYPPEAPAPTPVAPIARYDLCAVEKTLCTGLATRFPSINPRGTYYAKAESGSPEIMLTGPLSGAPPIGRRREGLFEGAYEKLAQRSPRVSQAPQPIPSPSARAMKAELDIEANFTIEVLDTSAATERVRALTQAAEGVIESEVFENNERQLGVALSIRVPSVVVSRFFAQLRTVGKVQSFTSKATDVGRKLADAELAARNLTAVLERYRALLAQATSVSDMANLEGEILRLQTALDSVRADLAWTRDRVARSTVYVRLTVPKEERLQEEKAKLHVGLRLPIVFDLRPSDASSSYVGGGLSLLIARPFNLDIDLLTSTSKERREGVDLLTATAGSELYSNLLGGGRRRFFNPYIGFRAGYATLRGDDALLLGGSVGVELVKSSSLILDVHTRAYALVATDDRTHVFVQPALTLLAAY